MRLWHATSPTPLIRWHVLMKPTLLFQFTIEVATNDRLPLIGMEIIIIDGRLETRDYRKKTNKGLLLHYQSHFDSRYKRSLLTTMLDRAKRLSSTQDFLSQECKNLKIRNRPTWFADNLAIWEQKLTNKCNRCLQAKRSLIAWGQRRQASPDQPAKCSI